MEAAERTMPDMRIMVDAESGSESDSLSATQVLAAGRTEPHEVLPSVSKTPSDFTKIVWGGKRVSTPADEARSDRVQSLAAPREPSPSSGSSVHLHPLPKTPLESSVPSHRAPPDAALDKVGLSELPPQSAASMAEPLRPQTPNASGTLGLKSAVPWTMILILNGIFVLAVLVVAFFALKR